MSQFGFEPQITEIFALGKHSVIDNRSKRQSKQIKLSPITKTKNNKLSDKKDDKSVDISMMKSESIKEEKDESIEKQMQKEEINNNLKLQLEN